MSDDPSVPASYRAKDAIGFYLRPVPEGAWDNSVTIRSTRAARMFAYGGLAVVLVLYLSSVGFSGLAIGAPRTIAGPTRG